MEDLNTCPVCGAQPVRVTPPFMFGQYYYECLNRECRNWSARYAESMACRHEPATAPTLPPPGPGPEVFYHGDPGDILGHGTDPTPARPVFLWTTRHNDFGDV